MNERLYWYLAIKAEGINEKTGIDPETVIRYVAATWLYPREDLCYLHDLTGIPCKTLKKLRKADHMICRVI